MNVNDSAPVVVIGALNLDVCGIPTGALRMSDSNPGHVSLSAGGVAHNIARHLVKAGLVVELAAPIGDDYAANMLTRFCRADGISLHHAPRVAHPSSIYMCLDDAQGDLVAAINDMSLLDIFTPAMIEAMLPALNAAPLVIADANLSADVLACLAERCTAPLLLDPVSTFKAERARSILAHLTAIKPNLLEARHLSGEESPEAAAQWFLQEGVQRVFISLGAEGILYADAGGTGRLPAAQLAPCNTNGAGDATCAGIALGMLRGLNAQGCAKLGIDTAEKHLLSQGGNLS